ncbi:MAG TPA: glycosyltransferase, partial [Patescibacteria group bacterium]
LVSKFNRLLIGSSKHIWPHLIAANKQTLLLHPNLKLNGNLILSLFHTAKYSRSDIRIIKDSDLPASKISRLKLFQRIFWHRLFHPRIFHFKSGRKSGAIGSGYVHRGLRYIIHTDLSHTQSAVNTFILPQKIAFVFAAAALSYLLIFHFWSTAIVFVAILTSIYFIDVLFNLYLIVKSLHKPPEISFSHSQIYALDPSSLPVYTVLCPLYREAAVVGQFIKSMAAMDWPKNKLDVILLLEEDDTETPAALLNINVPDYIRVVTVPHSFPKTKPKACNYGLNLAKGEYLVVYDAEDKPDRFQLKKAYLAFNSVSSKIFCLQAKLNYFNPHDNFLTRLFTAEYSLWFDIILPGLQSINTTIPLGGTSNHFRTHDLQKLHGWDPFNVTEDCDLGARLFKLGYKTAIIDSTTLEEANSNLKNWIRQRSRWIKGYLQTYLVHMRRPVRFFRQHGIHALIFQLIIGLRISFILINPLLWLTTISYFLFYPHLNVLIARFYFGPVFYMAVFALIIGNFVYLYNYMIGLAKKGHWSLLKYVFFVPFYWILMSFAAVLAFYQLAFKPHYWEKTHHGLGKIPAKKVEISPEPINLGLAASGASRLGFVSRFVASDSFVLVAATIATNIFNFIYNLFVVRTESLKEIALVSLFSNLLLVLTVPANAFTATITHQTAFYLGRYKSYAVKLWQRSRFQTLVIAELATLVWLLLMERTSSFFHLNSVEPLVIFSPIFIATAALAADKGFLNGSLRFRAIGFVMLAESATRLLFAYILVKLNLDDYIYASIPLSILVSFIFAWVLADRLSKLKNSLPAQDKVGKNLDIAFLTSSTLIKLSAVVFLSFDVVIVNHFLDSDTAGRYSLISLIGKMVFFISSLAGQFVIPLVSNKLGQKSDYKIVFTQLIFYSTIFSFLAFVGLGLFGYISAPLIFGQKAVDIVAYLPLYAYGVFCLSITSNIITYHQSIRNYAYSIVYFLTAVFFILGLYLNHNSLWALVHINFLVSVSGLAAVVLFDLVFHYWQSIRFNWQDFLGLFLPQPTAVDPGLKKLRILIFNWRDLRHVWAGGAEVYIHEIAKRLVKKGHQVTVFCGNDQLCPRFEIIDGVNIIRRGGFFTVYIWAALYYLIKFHDQYDLVIESQNGLPFFTPFYVRKPVIGLLHHVHKEVFFRSYPKVIALFASFFEDSLMPVIYRNIKMVTVSKSSKIAMQQIGFGRKKKISIVHPGVEIGSFKLLPKTRHPSLLYLGRLKPYKSVDVLIKSMPDIIREFPDARLTIAGFGESRNELENMVKSLGLNNFVKFAGKVSEKLKRKLLARSWVFIYPSSMEGWGIANIEANASGTPVVASNVPGLRDSVKNPHSGFLVSYGDPMAFSCRIKEIIGNRGLREKLQKSSLKWAKKFTWDRSVNKLLRVIYAANT